MKPIRISGELLDPEEVARRAGLSKREYKRLMDFVERSIREGVYKFPPRDTKARKRKTPAKP